MMGVREALRAVDEEMIREALERYPRGARLPHHDFSKPDLHDIGVSRVDEAQVRRRSKAPDCADVYEGYVPIDRLHPVLAEVEAARESTERECLDCGHVGDRADFKFGECPECGSENTQRPESAQYDWSEFSPRATFPVAQVRIERGGAVHVDDGNHRVTYWQDQGMTHAPAWVIDERPCVPRKMQRGDYVKEFLPGDFTVGRGQDGGTVFGIVESAGDKAFTVFWEFGRRRRYQQGDREIKLITDPELLAEAKAGVERAR